MRRGRESGLLSLESKIAAVLIVGLIVDAISFTWIGYQSTIYQSCLVEHPRLRGRGLICSFQLLEGDARDYLVFVGQWLPTLLVIGWFLFAFRAGRLFLIRPISDRTSE